MHFVALHSGTKLLKSIKNSIYKPIQLHKLQIHKNEKTPKKMIDFDITRNNNIKQMSP